MHSQERTPGLKVFIDANVYLSFYDTTNDDLQQLRKMIRLIEDGELELIINQQLFEEVQRNRDNKAATALLGFKKNELKIPFVPRFMNDYIEVKALRDAVIAARLQYKKALERGTEEAILRKTIPDSLIGEIFKTGAIHPISLDVFERARKRMMSLNPPGKDGSLGDRIHWEYLLHSCRSGEDLYLITRDGDFCSVLAPDQPHSMLSAEWRDRGGSNIYLYSEVQKFLSEKFKGFDFERQRALKSRAVSLGDRDYTSLRLAVDIELRKSGAISRLENSADPEVLIKSVEDLRDLVTYLTDIDIRAIFNAARSSSTIFDYALDPEIRDFFASLLPRAFSLFFDKDMRSIADIFDIDLREEIAETTNDPDGIDYIQLSLEAEEDERIEYLKNKFGDEGQEFKSDND